MILASTDLLDHVLPHALHGEPLLRVQVASEGTDIPTLWVKDGFYNLYFTNYMMMTLFVALLVILVFWLLSRKLRPSESGVVAMEKRGWFTQLFETMCVFVRDEVARPNLGHLTDKYIPYLWTIFFFILFSNLIGLIPFGYVLELLFQDKQWEHWGGTATANLSMNVILAIGSFIAIIGIGIREAGIGHFVGHFNPVGWKHERPIAFIMLPIGLMLFVLEWVGLLIKCTVLAMRLFGTMMAGHLVLAAIVGLIAMAGQVSVSLYYGVGVVVALGGVLLMMLEIFICMLQAFLFTFLTVLFISAGAVHEHEEHEHGAHDPLSDEAQMDIDKLLTPSKLVMPPV